MRVLHIGKFFPPYHGGMEVFLADLIDEQRRQGLDAHALVHGDPLPEDPPWLQRVPVQFSLVYAPIALGFRKALKQAIHHVQPDVLHLHMPNNSVFWALTLGQARDIPWVVHWHSDVVVSRIRAAVALAYRLYRPFEQAVLNQASRVIATSTPYLQASEPLQKWREKCDVVPLGLGYAGLTPSAEVEPIKAWTTEDNGTLRLLSIGRLTYYKGFETLVRAVAGQPGLELLIVGEGESRQELEALIAAHSSPGAQNVRLLGHVDDAEKHALLRGCDVFCLASRERTEAFGMVLLEAMYHARPCIVSDLAGSGMPWLVAKAGAGLRVRLEDDIAGWRDALRYMQEQPEQRAKFGAAGAHALLESFSIAACANALASRYAVAAPEASRPAPGKDLLVVIPARNEAGTIGEVLQHLRAAGWHHVLVINDQSTDDTAAIASAAGACVLNPVLPMGAWGGMQAGICYALRHGYQAVITMDADGQHEVDEIPVLLRAQNHADLVIGAYPERASRSRQWAWNWFRHLAGFDLRDLTSGFRLYNAEAMQVLASREATLLDYQDLGALLMVRRAGLRIAEVPVSMNLRAVGKSRIFNSWFSVAKYMAATTLLCLARWQVRRARGASL